MIDAKPLSILKKGEKNISLKKVIEDSLLDNPMNMWIVSGQLAFDTMSEEYTDYSLTFVTKSLENSQKFCIGVIVDGQHYIKERDISIKELETSFSLLFGFNGQLISLLA